MIKSPTPANEIVEYQPMIRDMAVNERPRERLMQAGSQAVSNSELLAIILRTGTGSENVLRLAERLLASFRDLSGLARASLTELQMVKGIGPAKAVEIKAALELGRRLMTLTPADRPRVTSPGDGANLLMGEMSLLEQEQLRVILLDTRNHVLRITTVYQGSLNSAQVRIGEIFKGAIKENAAAVIVAHNHPSGDPAPSQDDIRVTREMVKAGKLLDIQVLDHLVIGRGRFVSLKERGLGFDG